jgi:hypothetical protein
MHRTLLVTAVAVSFAGSAALAQDLAAQLSPKDPKYNSAACRTMRVKAKNYDGIFQQSTGSYIIAAAMPGGTIGFLATQHRKREMFMRQLEQACMTNPPNRSYLDPSATTTKD